MPPDPKSCLFAFIPHNACVLGFKACMMLLLIIHTFCDVLADQGASIWLKPYRMHAQTIVSADTDASGNLLLTTDRNGISILWDSRNLEPLNRFTIHDAYSEDYASALSGSGKLMAGGLVDLYVFESKSGLLVARTNNLPHKIQALKFIGEIFLALATDANKTVILCTKTWNVMHKLIHKHGNPVGLDADASGWLAVVCENGIELYDNNFNLNNDVALPGEMKPLSIKFSPDGSKLTVGFSSPHLPITFDTGELGQFIHPRFPQPVVDESAFSFVNYSTDGLQLLAAGNSKLSSLINEPADRYMRIRDNYFIGLWNRMGTGELGIIPVGCSPITSVITLPGGSLVYSDSSPALIRLSATGQEMFARVPGHNQFENDGEDIVLVNANADELVIRYVGNAPLLLSLRDNSFSTFVEDASKVRYEAARQEMPGLRLTGWKNSDSIFLNNKPITWIPKGDTIRCADIADHGLRFVLGSDKAIYCAGRDGDLIWRVSLHEPVMYVNISGNARVLVAALADGSLQWLRMRDGKTMLRFASYNNDQFWAFITGSGFVEHSAGAGDVFGLSVRGGENQHTTFVPLHMLDSLFFWPGIVSDLVQDWDEESMLKRAGTTVPDFSVFIHQPETIKIESSPASDEPVLHRFHLIVGSYPQKVLAENRVQKLLKGGFTGAKSLESGNRYRVSIQSFDKLEDATRQRNQLERQFSGIWILEYNGSNN